MRNKQLTARRATAAGGGGELQHVLSSVDSGQPTGRSNLTLDY